MERGQGHGTAAPAAPNLGGEAARVPTTWCQDWGLRRSRGAGQARGHRRNKQQGESSGKERGFGCLEGDTGCGGASGPHAWCWMHPKCCNGGEHLCRQQGGEEAQAALQEGRGRQQQRCSPAVCAHREDGLEVVEQLDVLGDARAGPADHIVLTARERRGGEEPAAGAGHQDVRAGAQRAPAQRGSSQAEAAGKQPTSKHHDVGWSALAMGRVLLGPQFTCLAPASSHHADPSSNQWL